MTLDDAWLAPEARILRNQWMQQFITGLQQANVPFKVEEMGGTVMGLFMPLRINGVCCGFSVSDVGDLCRQGDPRLMLLAAAMPWHEHLGNVCSFPFAGWSGYNQLAEAAALRERRDRDDRYAMARMATGSRHNNRPLLYARRRMLEERLQRELPGCRLGWRDMPEYFKEFCQASVIIHTGGAFANSWDRTSAQAFALGIPLVQPEICMLVGWERPTPGVHYVACRDDCADAADKANELLQDPDKADEIGRNALKFHEDNLSPLASWRRVMFYLHSHDTPPESL